MTCIACGELIGEPDLVGAWPAGACRPPTSDMPIPGHEVEIPAWCDRWRAYVWLDAGRVVSDRPARQDCATCRPYGQPSQIPSVVDDEHGTPLRWRPCPGCNPAREDADVHAAAVSRYGEDYF